MTAIAPDNLTDTLKAILEHLHGQAVTLARIDERTLHMQGDIKRLDTRMDGMETRLDRMDTRLTGIEVSVAKMDGRVSQMPTLVQTVLLTLGIMAGTFGGIGGLLTMAHSLLVPN